MRFDSMRKRLHLSAPLAACVLLVAVGGCGLGPVKYTRPVATAPPRELTAPERDYEAVWQASQEVLRRYYFKVDREDRRAGVITTYPMTGRHYWEIWRKDGRARDIAESTMQTLFLAARVIIAPSDPNATTFRAETEVLVTRSNKPLPQVTSTSEAYRLMLKDVEPEKKKKKHEKHDKDDEPESATLVDLGHDRAMEARLTRDIGIEANKLRLDPQRLEHMFSWPNVPGLPTWRADQWQLPQWRPKWHMPQWQDSQPQ